MSAELLPVEILVLIFENLHGKTVVACRAVCRRWRDVVDSLWERYCNRDFRSPKADHKVTSANPCNLSYRELYKSLALWSKVEEAEVTCKKVSEKSIHHFKILNNNTLAVLINRNQIEYYNLTNMELISTKCYDFKFLVYDENDKLIVLLGDDKRLSAISKSNERKFYLGPLHNDKMQNFKLFDTVVYFVSRERFLCEAQLKVVDSKETLEITEFDNSMMRYSVVAFGSSGKNWTNILADNGFITVHNRKLSLCGMELPFVITFLMKAGFDWTDPFFYRWLRTIEEKNENKNNNLGLPPQATKTSEVHTHNHIMLVGTGRSVHIFKQPYEHNETIKLYKSEPNRTIEMGGSSYNWYSNAIQQLGVVEVLNGHRIIVLNENQLFFVDLLHNTTTEQSAQCTDPITSTKKKPRSSDNKSVKSNGKPSKTKRNKNATKNPGRVNKNKKSTAVTKHDYNTRSMDKCSRSTKKKQ